MRTLAMGDPQAPFSRVLEILERHGALNSQGRIADDVHLVSMGDHFDWGAPAERERATHDALALLSWLASHDPSQCTILLGNHDLARVQELFAFTDETYAVARAAADGLYREQRGDERAFLEQYPTIATPEVLARDLSTFCVAQRTLVTELLRGRRFRLAAARGDVLCVHAGLTASSFAALGVSTTSAHGAATELNAWLDRRLDAWAEGPLDLAPLVTLASRATGESKGALLHRPAEPAHAASSPGRRYDPRELPNQFTQAIGHIRDKKCRDLMPSWSDASVVGDGPLRSLTVGPAPRYVAGVHADARLIFCDGGMSHAPVDRYELLDLDRRTAAAPR